jgi:hypothetical protein
MLTSADHVAALAAAGVIRGARLAVDCRDTAKITVHLAGCPRRARGSGRPRKASHPGGCLTGQERRQRGQQIQLGPDGRFRLVV